MVSTTVHLVRHGEVANPTGILYGRMPGYRLSELGEAMADAVAADLAGLDGAVRRDVTLVVASPLERAQQTAEPVGRAFGLPVGSDGRLIEAANHFEGLTFGVGDGSPLRPRHWRYLRNPLRPSWGEPYTEQAERMLAAVADARAGARGHEAVLVSHQLPIWVTRLTLEHRHLWHDPRRRQCSLGSVTSLRFQDDELVGIGYREPAASLLVGASTVPGA
ncbi:MAG: histidine phosphatase family protein [Micrococcales bacterium]|nr:histidine phosphatase family protein [Micrococcales bacterium]